MDIPQGIWDIYNTTTSDFISKNFGVPCKLIYGTNQYPCPNCIQDPFNRTSTNQYMSGGPIPFSGTVCPYCNGAGYYMNDSTETIKMRVYFTKKDFVRVEIPLVITNSTIQTIGFIEDLPKLQQAKEIIANSNVENYSIYRYELAAEVLPWGLGPVKKFCVAFWNRIQ